MSEIDDKQCIELYNSGNLLKESEQELEQISNHDEVVELQTSYIADAIINVKLKRFGESFTSIEEVLIMQKLIEKKLKIKKIKVRFFDTFFCNYFRVDNDVITKLDNSRILKDCIPVKEIQDTIYDTDYIYYCLCQMLINKLNNSIEHKCENCVTECTGLFHQSHFKTNNCDRWTHDFITDCKKHISSSEFTLIEESQNQQLKKNKKYNNVDN